MTFSHGSARDDERFVRRALALAALGAATAAPNPLVGAVIVRRGKILGQSFHRRAGEPHAEALALTQVGRKARGATLYTNLEPCCHVGRTPPCVQEIIKAGLARVVASMRDPNPKVNGGGFRELRQHGVDVDVGLLGSEAMRLNSGFVKVTRSKAPHVTLKGAVTLDGRIATRTGDSKWITSPLLRRHARLLRQEHDAVLIGIGTALADDPRLDRRPRVAGAATLLRVVLDTRLRLPVNSRLLARARRDSVVVFCGEDASGTRRRRLERAGAAVVRLPIRHGRLSVHAALGALTERGVTRLLVEGGGEVHGSFLEQGLADRLVLYVAPVVLGGRGSKALIGGRGPRYVRDASLLRCSRSTRIGEGWLIEGDIVHRG